MEKRELRIVRLMDPEMCLGCAFSMIAQVEATSGRVSRMIQCRRLDCDNWETSGAEGVRSVTSLQEA